MSNFLQTQNIPLISTTTPKGVTGILPVVGQALMLTFHAGDENSLGMTNVIEV